MGLQEPSELPLKIWSKHKKSIQSNSPYFLVLMPGKIRGSYSSKQWFVFSKIMNFCWEHVLGYNPNHRLDQWPNPYSYPRVKTFYFSANSSWSLRTFDGWGLCQVIDRTLLEKQFTLWKTKWCFPTCPKHLLRSLLTKLFSIFPESATGNDCCSDLVFIWGSWGEDILVPE